MPRSLALFLPLAVSLALSAGGAEAQTPAAPAAPESTAALFAPRVKPTAMVAELLESVEGERLQIAELRRSLAGTRSHSHRLEIQRRIERIKLDGEVARIRVQIGYARREKRPAVAEALERALDMLQSPAAPGQSGGTK
ncbi:MAG: hypothetical protein IT348_16060 [Candidatus Eisenbacteria bacterium]|nr:hypothetical protein [Candidatus Eisenbacteria bacterium]